MLNNLVITEMYLCSNYYPYPYQVKSTILVCSGNQNAMMSGDQSLATIYKTSHQGPEVFHYVAETAAWLHQPKWQGQGDTTDRKPKT